jgi:hypothetical protein
MEGPWHKHFPMNLARRLCDVISKADQEGLLNVGTVKLCYSVFRVPILCYAIAL